MNKKLALKFMGEEIVTDNSDDHVIIRISKYKTYLNNIYYRISAMKDLVLVNFFNNINNQEEAIKIYEDLQKLYFKKIKSPFNIQNFQ